MKTRAQKRRAQDELCDKRTKKSVSYDFFRKYTPRGFFAPLTSKFRQKTEMQKKQKCKKKQKLHVRFQN